MPLPNSSFVESPSLQNIFLNKDDGELLSAGVVTFYSDVSRTTLKPIYQQTRLPDNTYEFVELNNPVTLTSIGTYGDDSGNDINVYLYPFEGLPTDNPQGGVELYYITVHSSDGILQFTREAWPPNFSSAGTPIENFVSSDNLIENPQFVETFIPISTATVISVSGSGTVTSIAPDWDIVTNGSGTITVTWQDLFDITEPTGAPFAIDISSAGVTSVVLRQRIT